MWKFCGKAQNFDTSKLRETVVFFAALFFVKLHYLFKSLSQPDTLFSAMLHAIFLISLGLFCAFLGFSYFRKTYVNFYLLYSNYEGWRIETHFLRYILIFCLPIGVNDKFLWDFKYLVCLANFCLPSTAWGF